MSHCSKSDTGDATIGANKDICIGNYSIDRNSPSQCVLGDDMGVLMLVAREVNENGAKFCVTTIYAEHEKKGDAWTLYAEPAEGTQQCHWLCKPGYTGEKCQGTTLNGCDSVQFLRSDFDKYKMARSIGVESSIAMFHWNQYKSCGVHADQEHDMILVVSKWLEGGHGAWATPFVIRARREDYKSRKGGIDAWPAGESTLLCKNGYTANAAGNDCVAIDEATCAITQLCSGWSSNSYDQSTMKLSYDSEKKCYQYRCNNAGYAFPSTTDKTCQACFTNVRGGASPVDGTCVQCAVGQIFDETATDTGYCRATTSYSSTDLQYGKGKTRNNTSTSTASTKSLSTACWTFVSADDYKKCVIPGGGGK